MAANGEPVAKKFNKPELTLAQRRSIFFTCVNAERHGGMKRGFFKALSSNLPVAPRTVSRHWKEMRAKYEENVSTIEEIIDHLSQNDVWI